MRAVAVLLLLLGATAVGAAPPTLSVESLDSTVDIGAVSARPCRPATRPCPTIVRRRVAVRIARAPGGLQRTRLRAACPVDAPGIRVRVDGVPLSSEPRLVDGAAITGVALAHTIEVEIAPTAASGPLAIAIEWLAEDD